MSMGHVARIRRHLAWQREASRPGRRPTLETIRQVPGVREVVPVPEGLAVRFEPEADHETMVKVGSMAIRARG